MESIGNVLRQRETKEETKAREKICKCVFYYYYLLLYSFQLLEIYLLCDNML